MDKQLNLPLTQLVQIDIDDLKNNTHLDFAQDLSAMHKKKVIFNKDRTSKAPLGGWDPKLHNVTIHDLPEPRCRVQLVNLDSTCVPVAATDDATIFASRAVVVFTINGAPNRYIRLGPLLFHLDQPTIRKVLSLGAFSHSGQLLAEEYAFSQRLVRVRLERAIGLRLVQSLPQGILVMDGSLRTSIFDIPKCSLDDILQIAENNRIDVIGVCKSSSLNVLNALMASLMKSDRTPIYADVHDLVSPLIRDLRGKVFLARFAVDGPALRVDVRSVHDSTPDEVLSKFRFSDIFSGGYSESLRLAHHLSVLSSVEIACIRAHLAKNLKLQVLPAEDCRSKILGKFGPLKSI